MAPSVSVSAACLCAALLLGLCSARGPPPCPAPCRCQEKRVTCEACPTDYITASEDTETLSVTGCRNIEYLLRLHRPKSTEKESKYPLQSLTITNSFVEKIPDACLSSDYSVRSLILSNNSIAKIDVGLVAANLTFLDLSGNNVSAIDNRTFEYMRGLTFLDLSGNAIASVAVECFIGLDKLLHLDLSFNNLTLVDDAVFLPLSSLQQLNLSANRLEALSERSFSSLLLLQQLDVSYNRLIRVAPGALQFLPNLARLLLADNPQLRPDAQVFVGTGRRLQQVDASRTGLSQVPEALTHSVRFLSLAGNRIASVSRGDLDSYPLLHLLDLGHNIISDIEDDALGRLEALSQLYLNTNNLCVVPKMLPEKLSYLSLDSNSIGNLTILDFTTLPGLKVLLLSNNLISFIQENVFVQLVSLEVLDLSSNPLKVLTPNTFNGPVALKDLRVAFVNITPPARDISFPVPSPEGIENLHLEFSPGLTRELLADTAALAAMTRLQLLDMRFSNITELRSDLLHYLPQLKILRLEGNKLNCSDLNWLADWMREYSSEDNAKLKCYTPKSLSGKLVADLPTQKRTNRVSFIKEKPNDLNVTLEKNFADSKITNISEIDISKQIDKALNVTPEVSTLSNHIEPNESPDNSIRNQVTKNIRVYIKEKGFLQKTNGLSRKMESSPVLKTSMTNSNYKNTESRERNSNKSISFSDAKYVKENNSNEINENKERQKTIKNNYIAETGSQRNATEDATVAENQGDGHIKARAITTSGHLHLNSTTKNKLVDLFSELSRKSNNYTKLITTNKSINQNQKNASPCSESGNLNGTENKTKCSQHPAGAPPEIRENKNAKPERFIYRKNGSDKSSVNTKSKKSKSAQNATKYYDNNYNKDQAKSEESGRRDKNETIEKSLESESVKNNYKLTSLKVHRDVADNTSTSQLINVDVNKEEIGNKGIVPGNTSKEYVLLDSERVDNNSGHQSSGFRAEGGAEGGHAVLALVAVGAAACACAAAGGACLARRARPRPVHEAMEVPTISAVGELW